MDLTTRLRQSEPFLQSVTAWEAALPTRKLSEVAADPARTVLIAVDVTNGFCHAGPLASPRVKNIIAPIVALLESAFGAGVRQFVLPQDTHEPDAVEFGQFPPHCVRGTLEVTATDAVGGPVGGAGATPIEDVMQGIAYYGGYGEEATAIRRQDGSLVPARVEAALLADQGGRAAGRGPDCRAAGGEPGELCGGL